MKKLMTVVSVAATLLAFGAVNGDEVRTFTNTGFEDNPPYKAGELLSTTNDDAGKVAGESGFAATWVALPEEEVVEHEIRAYGESDPAPEGGGTQYLHVESSNTSTLLQRNVQPGGTAASIGDGIYLDTLVKFSPADKLFEASDITTGDKIAITYVGEDATEVANPISNIVVCAGYVDGSTIVPTNYVMNLPDNADFDVNAWHRLTVRSIANVGSSVAPVGFAIYIDGNPKPLTYASDVAAGDLAYVGSLNAAVQTYLYNGEKHALLPSLVNSGDNKTTITTVGFKGSGCVDNLAFTANPGFIEEGTAVEIAWDAGVATYTVVDSEGNTLVDGAATGGEAGSRNLLLEVGITYLTVTATYGTGYEAGTWTVTGDGAAISGGTFTVAEGAKLNINSMTPKFDVGGVHYGSFDDALDAAAGADEASMGTIKLLVDVVGDNEVSDGWVTIDLAGKTLTGVTDAAIINSGATLFITNSTAEIGHVAAGTAGEAVLLGDGNTFIYAGWFDGEVLDDGAVSLVVYGGYYLDENAEEEVGDFYLYRDKYVDDGVKVTYYGEDYFQVGESVQPPAPTTYELRIPAVTGASATVTDKATSSVIADLTAIEDGTVVTVTWTADSGYKITAGDTEEITMDDNQTATAPTVVAITYATLTITPVANCTIIVSNATAEVATGATFDVDDAVELTVYRTPAEGYELDNCAATETITMDQDQTVTAAVKQSGGDWPSTWNGGTQPASMATAFDTWVAAGNDPTAENAEAAFLVGVDVDDYTSDLAAASISIVGGKIVITGNYNLSSVNGALSVKMGDAPNALNTTTSVVADEGAITLAPALGETKKFYQLVIGYPAN